MTSEQQQEEDERCRIDDNLESHVKLSISADEVNLLIYRYLLEAGFRHTAFTFEAESKVPETSPFATTQIPPGALISLLQKALIYLYIQSHCGKNGEQIKCEGSFSLLRPHEHLVPTTTVSEEDEEEEEGGGGGEASHEYSTLTTSVRGETKTNIRIRDNIETDDTSIEDDEEDEDDEEEDNNTPESDRRRRHHRHRGGGSSGSSSPRSKRRRRRRRLIQEDGDYDGGDVKMMDDDIIKDDNIEYEVDNNNSSVAGSRISKVEGEEDEDIDDNNKEEEDEEEEGMRKEEEEDDDEQNDNKDVVAASSSPSWPHEASVEVDPTTAVVADGGGGGGEEEGSVVVPKTRKRGRLVTTGPLAAAAVDDDDDDDNDDIKIEDNKDDDIELKDTQMLDNNKEEEDINEGVAVIVDDNKPIMPLVYQLLDPSRDTSSLRCPSPVVSMQWSPLFKDLLATANSDGQLSLFWSPSSSSGQSTNNEDNNNNRDKVEWNIPDNNNNGNNNVIGYLMLDGPTTTTTTTTSTSTSTSTSSQIYLSWSPTSSSSSSAHGGGGDDSINDGVLYSVIAMASESSPIIRLRWINKEENNRGYSIAGKYDIKYPIDNDPGDNSTTTSLECSDGGGYHCIVFCGSNNNISYLSVSCNNESIIIYKVNCSKPNDIPEIIFKINDTPSFSLTWLGYNYLAIATLSPYILLIDIRDGVEKKLLINIEEEDDDDDIIDNNSNGGGGGGNRFILECAGYDNDDGLDGSNTTTTRLAAITDSEPTDTYIIVWMDPIATRHQGNKPIILKPPPPHNSNTSASTSSTLQVQEMLRWMPGSGGNILCACYEGGIVLVWDIINKNILYQLPCIDNTITAISWQNIIIDNNNLLLTTSSPPPLLVTLVMGRKCLIWSEGKIISAFDLRCDDDNASGCLAWSYNSNYLATAAGGNETPLIFNVTPVVKEANRRRFMMITNDNNKVNKK